MNLPFTVEQFLNVFASYNTAVWPMQILLNLCAIGILGLVVLKRAYSGRVISLALGLLWGWTGLAYHLAFFSGINPAARAFAGLCVLQGVLMIVFGTCLDKLRFTARPVDWRHLMGWLLIGYALLLYPLLGLLFGHTFPAAPTFGLPCPTTIFTIGILFLAFPATPWYLVIIPVIWAAIGGMAAFSLGIHEDIGLLLSGLAATSLWFKRKPDAENVPAEGDRFQLAAKHKGIE